MATGTYAFPKKFGIQIAVDSFTKFLENHDMEITLVVFGSSSVRITGELGEEIAESFIDDAYVDMVLEDEYAHDGYPLSDDYYEAEEYDEAAEEDVPIHGFFGSKLSSATERL